MKNNSHTSLLAQPVFSASDALLVAICVAATVHVFVVLGLNFDFLSSKKVVTPIEITLSNVWSEPAAKKTKFLAPTNQRAASKNNQQAAPPKPKTVHPRPSKKQVAPVKVNAKSKPKTMPKPITQPQAKEKIIVASKPVVTPVKKMPRLSGESLSKQISRLGEQILHKKPDPKASRIKFVHAVNAHKSIVAQYKRDWEQKIERIGNRNYPDIAKQKNFTSTLTMDVGINADGSIAGISIIKSSGNKRLDAAAKRIVMLSTPFPALPSELLEELDVLRIRRVWNFYDESGV